MKWLGVLTLTSAVYAATAAAQAHVRCQSDLGSVCGDSSRPREANCCDKGYCQPWNSGYYQCIEKPAKCPAQETDIDFAGNDIKTVYGLQPDKCCDECAKTANCKAYTFVNQNPDGKTACYLKSSDAGRVEKKGAVSANVVVTTTQPPTAPPPPAKCPTQENNVDYYGNDLKTLNGVTQTACCDACSTTAKCVAYTYVTKDSACYLKSSIAGKVSKAGAVSGQLQVTQPPPPPAKCPEQENNVDYYGNDIKSLNGVTQTVCCDECSKLVGCVAYTFFEKNCYLKSSTKGKVAKTGAISGVVKDPATAVPPTPPPAPANCPVQDLNTDYFGNDLRSLKGVTQTACCDACTTTAKCVGYSFVAKEADGKSGCYLKSSTAGKVAKAGVVSGTVVVTPPPTPPPAPANCPVQELNTDYFGNDLKTLNGGTQTECCDACGTTAKCVAYSFVAKGSDGKSACYLKSSAAGKVAKAGVVSGKVKSIPVPANCPTQELNTDYPGNDIKNVRGVTYGQCCDACGATSGCSAFTYVEQNPDGKSACYLKSGLTRKNTKEGAISGVYQCPTEIFGKCGSQATGPLCCPSSTFCQPWDTGFYQCVPTPDIAKCPTLAVGVDFYGGDLETKYGLLPGTCCDACFNNKDCVVFTFVNENPDGRSACYLKSKLVEQRPKAGAVSGYKVKPVA